MKLAIFTDLHLGIKQDNQSWHEVALEWCDDMVGALKERNVKTIVFLGDFFHNRNTISVDTLNVASKFLNKLKDFDLHIILGNHDLYYSNVYDVSAVNIFDGYPNITVYKKPTIVQFGSRQCVMCGWKYNTTDYSGDILFTHAEISMFKFNRVIRCDNSNLKCSDLLKNYKIIYSGHFHLRQSKEYENGKVYYPGSPYQCDFSDEGCPRGFDIFDTETFEIEFIENTKSPKFVKCKLSELVKCRDFEKIKGLVNNNYFKVIIDKNISLKDLDELMSLINLCNPRNSSFEWENGQSFVQNIDENELITENFELSEIMKEYVDLIDTENKEEIKEYLLDLYNKVVD